MNSRICNRIKNTSILRKNVKSTRNIHIYMWNNPARHPDLKFLSIISPEKHTFGENFRL